jgi:flagellin
MSRINTNVTSLVAQNILGRSNSALEQALNRLSTGLRINTGKDDPAGLIASENLRSDITSIKKAISNTDRANQVIATADSALGQVSSLLNDIRGLVTESANTGALSDDQIAANQLQIDSSLAALNRIAQTTSFQGRRLLDGSLDFITEAGTNFNRLGDLNIEQANLGATGSLSVDINVTAAATQAQIDVDIPTGVDAVSASDDFTITNAAVQSVSAFSLDTTATISFQITSLVGGSAAGSAFNGGNVTITDGNTVAGGAVATYNSGTNTIEVEADLTSGGVTGNEIAAAIAAINGGLDFAASATAGGATNAAVGDAGNYNSIGGNTTSGRNANSYTIEVTADTAGTAANGVDVVIAEDGTVANTVDAEIDTNGDIQVHINGTVTKNAILQAINNLAGYTAIVTSQTAGGDANYVSSLDNATGTVATLANGVAASGGLAEDVTFQLAGKDGVEVFTFQQGTTITTLEDTLAGFSDATGITATANGQTLELRSSAVGSDAFIDIRILSEEVGGTFSTELGSANAREEGTDIEATVNGIAALGKGNVISLSTATLSLNSTVAAGFTGNIAFDITGGGALFQLGPDVVSNQQARFGITSVNSSLLGGASGKLFELKSGEVSSLSTDPTTAFRIVEEAINKITSLRGRLGSFQRTTLETNKNALGDTLVNLTDAESSIRDADFAAETAALTRAQILVQSGTTVLSIANQNPQNVLALLR